MVKYSFTLKIKSTNETHRHTVDLEKSYEDMPERFFTPDRCAQIRSDLQRQSSCRINDINLKRMVETWIQDIKEGYRDSGLTLDLPLMGEGDCDNLKESGNQEIPASAFYPSLSDIEPRIGAMPPLNFS